MLQYGARRRCFLSIGIEDYAFRPLKHAEKDAEVLAFKFQTRGSAQLGGLDGLVILNDAFLESLACHTKTCMFRYVSIFVEEILHVLFSGCDGCAPTCSSQVTIERKFLAIHRIVMH